MKKFIFLASLLVGFVVFQSCKKSGSTSTTNMRLVNLSPNSPAMDVYLNSTLVVGNVSYGVASGYQSVNAASSSIAINQTGTANILLTGNIAFAANNYYSSVVYDSVGVLKGNIFQDDRTAPPAGKCFVRFFDYVSGTPSIDIIRVGSTTNKLFASRAYLDHINTTSNIAYTAIDPGPVTISAVIAGTSVLITTLPGFEAAVGKSYTLVLKGFNNGTGTQAIFLAPLYDN